MLSKNRFFKILILICLSLLTVQLAGALDKYSYVMGVSQSYSEINITPENASRYGIRIYITGDAFRTDFKVKIANGLNGSKYLGHTVLVGMEDSYFRYSGFGCKAKSKGIFFLVSTLNSRLDSTVLKLDYLMSKSDLKKERITSLDIDLKAFIEYKDKEPDLYEEHWVNGVGPLDKNLEKNFAFKSDKECGQFGLF